ncbi:MAG TPA: DUF4389 domain-containing protein [Mycobacteriales bacterium]
MTPPGPVPVELLVRRDLPRNRLTVFFRLLLAIPHLVLLFFLGVAAAVVVVVGWFAALVLGRLPAWAHEYVSGWLRWSARVNGYLMLITDVYPPFSFELTDHPVRLVVPPPGPLNRWAVLGRIVLVVPAYVLTLAGAGMNLFVVFAWFAGVFAGRTPRAVFDAIATVQRFGARTAAYLFLLTPIYPWGAFGDRVESGSTPTSPPGWPAGYPYGTETSAAASGEPPAEVTPPPQAPQRPRPSPYPRPPAPTPAATMPPIWAYPPMPPAVPAVDSGGPPAEPAWFTGVVTNGGRAIVIIALVLGVGNVARAALVGGGTGGSGSLGSIGALTHLGTTVQVLAARTDVNDATHALEDGTCDQTTDSYCALTKAQALDDSLTQLRGHVRSGPSEGGRRDQVLADITALRLASGRALDDDTLLAGGRLEPGVATAIDTLDHDLDGYVDRLQGR